MSKLEFLEIMRDYYHHRVCIEGTEEYDSLHEEYFQDLIDQENMNE